MVLGAVANLRWDHVRIRHLKLTFMLECLAITGEHREFVDTSGGILILWIFVGFFAGIYGTHPQC